jgi:hypothetical protein
MPQEKDGRQYVDLKVYYSKVREAEATLTEDNPVMVSLVTSEGGKAGVSTEAPRNVAARLIAEGRARVATAREAEHFHELHREARARYEQQEMARRIQVVVVPQQDLKKSEPSKNELAGKRDRS